jgi:DNA adenine methylase Dam
MTFIKSPLNYTGNKFRILEQISKYFPKKVNTFVDLFSGGATVGFNVNADKIILIDNNEKVINLLKYLATVDIRDLIQQFEIIIERYNLSFSAKYGYSKYKGENDGNNGLKNFNQIGFKNLKNHYNNIVDKNSTEANNYLYLLMVYGFNNDIRFNSNGEFNLPIGKTDLNSSNIKKLREFSKRAKQINYQFILGDFRDPLIQNVIKDAEFIYADPPYLITRATYNEKNGWSTEKEIEFLEFMNNINNLDKKFVISNVIEKKGHKNNILIDWVKSSNFKVIDIDYHYRSSSYNKINRDGSEREIIITNW